MKIIKCIRCGRKRKHGAFGMCDSCYVTVRAQTVPKYHEMNRAGNVKWKKEHKSYWETYYAEHKKKLQEYGREYYFRVYKKKRESKQAQHI